MKCTTIYGHDFRCHAGELPYISMTFDDLTYNLNDLINRSRLMSRVIDIGAGSGDFALRCSMLWNGCQIVSIEPHQALFENLILNSQSFNVTPIWGAVSPNNPTDTILEHESGNPCLAMLEHATIPSRYRLQLSPVGVSVDAVNIANIATQQFGSEPIDLLKLNCNGSEVYALNQLKRANMLRKTFDIRCLTFGDTAMNNVLAILDDTHSHQMRYNERADRYLICATLK